MSGNNSSNSGGGDSGSGSGRGQEHHHQSSSRYRYPGGEEQQPTSTSRPPPASNIAAAAGYSYSYSSSAPYRLANAAAAAASPLLGYLSGNSGGGSSNTPQRQQQDTGNASNSNNNTNTRRGSSASTGYPLSTDEISAAAAIAGSPGSSNVSPYATTTTSTSYGKRGSNTTGTTSSHQRTPSSDNPHHIQQPSSAGHTRTVSSSSASNPAAAAVNMRRTSSISDEDARKKDSRNLDSIVLQFFSKAAQVVTQARFTHVSMTPSSNVQGSSTTSAPKKSRNRWFNLELDESDIFKDELRTWRSVTSLLAAASSTSSSLSDSSTIPRSLDDNNTASSSLNYMNVPSMVIEIILDVSDISPNQVLVLNNTREGKRFRVDLSGKGRTVHLNNPTTKTSALTGTSTSGTGTSTTSGKCNIVLERWTLALRPPPPPGPLELPTVYKHCIILFRALYTLVRTLPIFELHRRLKRRTGRSEIKIGCRLSTGEASPSASDTTSNSDAEQENELDGSEIGLDTPLGDEDDASFSVLDFAFAPVVTPIGSLDLRCRYRACVDFSVEEIEALLSSRFIDEDFFKPTMRKYSSSGGPGSIPTRLSGTSPLQTYSRSQQRPSSTPLSAGRPTPQPQPVPIAMSPEQAEEGAFVSYGKSKGAEVLARVASHQGSPGPEMSRRPSIGGTHPFRPSSASPIQGGPRSYSTPPQDINGGRYSASPASVGPSSSLRYTVGTSARSSSGGSTTPGPSVSQLSYTKRQIPSPTNTQPPISALTAMHLGTSPSPPSVGLPSGLGTQPMPVPGTSAIPLSSSPTPSLIKRYSSSRYGRSFGQVSSGSSPGDHQGFWGPESLGRRSRLSSGHSREDIQPSSLGSRNAAAQQASAVVPAGGNAQDADQIKSFLGMIDSRAQLPGGSLLLGGGSPSRTMNKSTVLNRFNAEEKLRNLADSVMRDSPARSASSASSHSTTSGQHQRQPSTSYAQPHMRRRSGEFVASMPTSSRQSPSPDMYSASPVEGQFGNVRPRISQPPMSTSIPEEDSRHPHIRPQQQQQQHSAAQSQQMSVPRSEGSSLTSSNPGSQFPFPRYVPSSMRRRGSSQSSASRPAMPSPSASASRGQSPMQASGEASNSDQGPSPLLSQSQREGQSGSGDVNTSQSTSTGGEASTHSEQHSSQVFEGGEEQAVAQLELGIESTDDVRRYDRSRMREPPKDYRWGRKF